MVETRLAYGLARRESNGPKDLMKTAPPFDELVPLADDQEARWNILLASGRLR